MEGKTALLNEGKASVDKKKNSPPTYAEATKAHASAPYDDNDNAFYDENVDAKHEAQQPQVDVGELLPVPPDGGYGWVIVIAAFFCNLIVDGTCNAFGQFSDRYVQYFQSDKATVGFVVSCQIGAYLLIGPVVSGLTNKYGARIVVIAGGLISGTAILASAFSPNIYVMIFLYGIVSGIGFGFVYLPAICVVCYYFEKKRSLATGLAVAGSGAGTIVMPPLCEALLTTFGIKGTLFALAGIAFSCVGLGVLYRPLLAKPRKEVEDGDKELQPLTGNGAKLDNLIDNLDSKTSPSKRVRSAVSESDDPSLRPLIGGTGLAQEGGDRQVRSRNHTQNSVSSEAAGERRQSKMSVKEYTQSITRLAQANPIKGAESLASVASSIDPKEFAKPLNRSDIFYQGSIQNLPEFQKEGRDFRKYRESQVSIPAEVAAQAMRLVEGKTELETELLEPAKGSCSCLPPGVRNVFAQMLDVELLKNTGIILVCVSNLFAMIGFYVPFMYMYDMARSRGIPAESATLLLPILGVFNTLGRVVSGWLADRKWLSALALNNISLISCGFLTFICPYLTNFIALLIYSIIFGFIISAYICLTSIVLTELVGLEKLTNAFGILVVARSIACFVGTPLAGAVYVKTQSYDASFNMGAVMILLGGLATCAISFMDWMKARRAARYGNRRTDGEEINNLDNPKN